MYKKFIIIFIILCSVTSAAFASETILTKAKKYLPQLSSLMNKLWPNMPRREIIPAQIEQESQWNPKATRKNKRELGMGFGQITITYKANGQERYNNFKNAVAIKQLKSWPWKSDPYNTEFQMTYLLLTDKSNYNTFRPYFINDDQALKAMLVGYNAGTGRIIIRRAYAKSHGMKANSWDKGLDGACSPSEIRTKIAGESLCKMVGEYPTAVFKKAPKYEDLMK